MGDPSRPTKVSFGLFQINISANELYVGGAITRCPKAFNQMFTADTKNTCMLKTDPDSQQIYNTCKDWALNPQINILNACRIYQTGRGRNGQNRYWNSWGANSICRF